mmetsp:Transcript_16135/g.28642  ORF Transcript_16135/g.28642 Transcript_16135/m.28642 type:complete len:188 (-) Transcript_16135:166-729(-)
MEYPFGVVTERTKSGIPSVKFIEDVGEFMQQDGATTKEVIEVIQSVHSELAKIEQRLTRMKETIKDTIPEIEENLEVVAFAKAKKDAEPIRTNFQVSASIFAEADLDQSNGKVVLWLGANTACELTYDEAEELLRNNLKKKEEALKNTIEDLKFTKAQITTAEVSIARVYNNDVKVRRAQRDEEEEE